MGKPYDATTRDLLETAPADWLAFLGHPVSVPVTVIDADLSSVTAEADKVLRVDESPPWIAHIEFQASRDDSLPTRLLRYNALLTERHRLSVSSCLILMRPGISGPGLSGTYRDRNRFDGREHRFPYHLVRLWEQPVEDLLRGGLGTLPLAPVADVPRDDLPSVVERMKVRLRRSAPPSLRAKLWAATYLLMGVRYPEALIDRLLEGVQDMEESVTYQALLRKGQALGKLEEARSNVIRAARHKFRRANAAAEARLARIDDPARLEELLERVIDVDSWKELVAALD